MLILGRHQAEQFAHLLHVGHVRDVPRHHRQVVTEPRRLADGKSHRRQPPADVQPGEDRLGDQIDPGFLERDLLALLIQVGADQAELGQGRLLDELRLAKVQHVPFPNVRLASLLHPQLDHVPPRHGTRGGFQLTAQTPDAETPHFASMLFARPFQHQDLDRIGRRILDHAPRDFTLAINPRHVGEIVERIQFVFEGHKQIARLGRFRRHLRQWETA